MNAVFGGVQSVAFWPDGEILTLQEIDGIVKVWDAAVGRELTSFFPWTR